MIAWYQIHSRPVGTPIDFTTEDHQTLFVATRVAWVKTDRTVHNMTVLTEDGCEVHTEDWYDFSDEKGPLDDEWGLVYVQIWTDEEITRAGYWEATKRTIYSLDKEYDLHG
jgi:hypothetical protein